MNSSSLPTPDQSRLFKGLAISGILVLAAGIAFFPERIWGNLFVGIFYLLTIALGGALFVALTYISGAGWHVAFRRIPESMARLLPAAGIAMLIVLAAKMQAYGWHHHGEGDAGTFWFKELWLTPSFWMSRAVAYVLVWILFANRLIASSKMHDESDDPAINTGSVRLSALFLFVYALTFSAASIDWLMALEPLWFSTMWGVYNFSGMIQAALAVVIILGLVLRRHGRPLHGVFNDEHLHDLGKLLIGFSCFWMYIWFSQYMLIWYSNIPEETTYFIARMHGTWGPVVVIAIVLNWIVPFFVLLPKPAKRSGSVMMKIAVIVLIGRWVDLYLMVFPSMSHETEHGAERLFTTPVFSIWEIAGIAGLIGTASLLLLRFFAAAKPVPTNDPYLHESLHYHAS